jgi:hypothetical protein
MTRTHRTTWRSWVDAWLSGLPRASTQERAAEDKLAALTRELGADREEAVQTLGPARVPSFALSGEGGAANPAALAG